MIYASSSVYSFWSTTTTWISTVHTETNATDVLPINYNYSTHANNNHIKVRTRQEPNRDGGRMFLQLSAPNDYSGSVTLNYKQLIW